MRPALAILAATTLLSGIAVPAAAQVNVVASIKPVHSLVAGVMQGVGEPGLIVEGAGSPHTYALKPSQAAMLEKADVIFWVGHELEAFLEKPLETVGSGAKSVELVDAHDLVKLGFRDGGAFEKHKHGDDEGHEDEAGHDHGEKAGDTHGHDHEEKTAAGHEHEHGRFDAHIWLDPENAKAMVHAIEEALAAADPDNAATYKANAAAMMARLDGLVGEVDKELEPVKDKGFIVFHDAYQYFETRFGLKATGSITVSPEVMPGAERVSEIRGKVKELGAACVFAEPQFEPRLVATVTEGTQAKSAVLDPLGSGLADGPDLYFQLIRTMATSFRDCLSAGS